MTMFPGVTYYRHSGRFRPGALLGTLVVGSLLGIIVGSVYGYLTLQSSLYLAGKALVFVNLVSCLIAAVLVGYIFADRLRNAHVRSVFIGAIASILITAVTLYAAWVAWFYALTSHGPAERRPSIVQIARPDVLWRGMQVVNDHGIWGLGGKRNKNKEAPVTGLALTALWIAEVGVFLLIGVKAARKNINENVYCEHCQKWGTQKSLARLAPDDTRALRQSLQAGDLSRLESLEPSKKPSATELALEGCPDCDNLQTLTVTITREQVNPKSKETTLTTETVVRRMNLSPEQIVSLALIAAKTVRGQNTPAEGAQGG